MGLVPKRLPSSKMGGLGEPRQIRSSNTRNSDQQVNFSTIYLIEIAIDTGPGDLHAISLELCHKLLYLYLLL
jgi:hypothetical protein